MDHDLCNISVGCSRASVVLRIIYSLLSVPDGHSIDAYSHFLRQDFFEFVGVSPRLRSPSADVMGM